MKILSDDRVLGARELEHLCLNARVEGQRHTFANLVVNASKNSSQIASCVKTYEYRGAGKSLARPRRKQPTATKL